MYAVFADTSMITFDSEQTIISDSVNEIILGIRLIFFLYTIHVLFYKLLYTK